MPSSGIPYLNIHGNSDSPLKRLFVVTSRTPATFPYAMSKRPIDQHHEMQINTQNTLNLLPLSLLTQLQRYPNHASYILRTPPPHLPQSPAHKSIFSVQSGQPRARGRISALEVRLLTAVALDKPAAVPAESVPLTVMFATQFTVSRVRGFFFSRFELLVSMIIRSRILCPWVSC